MDALNLAAKDKYLQSLGSKVCAFQNEEPRKQKFVSKRKGSTTTEQPKKKRKKRKKQPSKEIKVFQTVNGDQPKTGQGETKQNKNHHSARVSEVDTGSFSTVNILRQRLHEKLQESQGQLSHNWDCKIAAMRKDWKTWEKSKNCKCWKFEIKTENAANTWQGNQKGLLPEELEKKRLRRKQERERKKRKRKELLRMKKEEKTVQESNTVTTRDGEKKDEGEKVETQILFNKVDVMCEAVKDNKLKKKEKRKSIKGGITPLTGRNYKQLLSRLEAHKNKIEELKSKDENKAKEVEAKMKWTNVLYKAEGLKIKDNEELLKASLKRKEKLKSQRQKRWEKRTEHVVEKMQQRQDKRKTNLKKKKEAAIERRKNKARKKGRILPEDLK